MRSVSFIIMFLLIQAITLSQPCLPEGITFTTQEQIDSFPINYPNCTGILGDVRIRSLPVTEIDNLAGLNAILAIGGDLIIESNYNLHNLSGLENLVSIMGNLDMDLNNFDALTGLDNLSYVGGDLVIGYCNAIEDFNGLNSLTTVGGKFSIYENNSLANFTGLENLKTIGGNFTVVNHHSLENFIGLENLESIGGWLYIGSNYILNSLTGLENLDVSTIDMLIIHNNLFLSECDIPNICEFLKSPGGFVEISGNSTGCNSVIELAEQCGSIMPCLPYGSYFFHSQSDLDNFPVYFPDCESLEGSVFIMGNDIKDLSALTSVSSIGWDLQILFTPSLTDLSGLNNIVSIGNDLVIIGNLSLTSLSGLDNIISDSITYLHIYDNPVLSNCHINSVCGFLRMPAASYWIKDNALGCDSPEEVQDSCYANSFTIEESGYFVTITIHPNPFSTSTTLSFRLGKPENVQFTVYNVQSQIVYTIEERRNAGEQQIEWNADGLPAGLYFYRLEAGDRNGSGKLVIK